MGPIFMGASLMLHLGMTGQLLYLKRLPRGWRTEPHLHLVLGLGDGFLLFRDPRKFGKCALLWGDEVHPRLARLGVDALVVRGRHLQTSGRGRRVAIKTFLLEQAVVAGVGNIYADEALFRVGIAPDVPCSRLTPSQWDSLAGEIRAVLRQAIRRGGSTVSDYRRPDGSRGGAQASHRVYGRTGQPCLRCGSLIQRLVLGGRSAHFCPRCQGRV